jgi:hypothetical protein
MFLAGLQSLEGSSMLACARSHQSQHRKKIEQRDSIGLTPQYTTPAIHDLPACLHHDADQQNK